MENNISEEHFFNVIKTGLAHKRKVLIKNLEENFEKESVRSALDSAGVDVKARGEDIGLSIWIEIAKKLL